MTRIALALALTLTATAALAELRVVDGDTVVIDGIRIRIENIDTPEMRWPRERGRCVSGERAKARLRELLEGQEVTYVGAKLDVYRRTLALVYAGGKDVGEQLIEEGLAVRYRKGSKAKAARIAKWCSRS